MPHQQQNKFGLRAWFIPSCWIFFFFSSIDICCWALQLATHCCTYARTTVNIFFFFCSWLYRDTMLSFLSTGRKSNCAAASQCLSVFPPPLGYVSPWTMSWGGSGEFGWSWAPLYFVGTSRSHASNPAPLLKECLHATLRGQRWILQRAVTKQIRLTSSLRPGRRCTDPCLLTCKFLGSGTCSWLVCSGQIIKLLPAIGLSWFHQHYSDTAGCTYR